MVEESAASNFSLDGRGGNNGNGEPEDYDYNGPIPACATCGFNGVDDLSAQGGGAGGGGGFNGGGRGGFAVIRANVLLILGGLSLLMLFTALYIY